VTQIAADLYGKLNGAIHSNEARFINRGASGDTWVGLQFKRDQYIDWCDHFVQVVTVGIRLLTYTLALHFATPKLGGFKCHQCDGLNTFSIVRGVSEQCVLLKCSKCGAERDLLREVAQAYGLQTPTERLEP
jgi:hypothetical protein